MARACAALQALKPHHDQELTLQDYKLVELTLQNLVQWVSDGKGGRKQQLAPITLAGGKQGSDYLNLITGVPLSVPWPDGSWQVLTRCTLAELQM
jgi:hypothetical protein